MLGPVLAPRRPTDRLRRWPGRPSDPAIRRGRRQVPGKARRQRAEAAPRSLLARWQAAPGLRGTGDHADLRRRHRSARRLPPRAPGRVEFASFSADGQRALTASREFIFQGENSVQVWDVSSGKGLSALKGHTSVIETARFSPDRRRVLTASLDNTARLWRLESNPALASLRTGWRVRGKVPVCSPDGALLLLYGTPDGAELWDWRKGAIVATFQGHEKSVHTTAGLMVDVTSAGLLPRRHPHHYRRSGQHRAGLGPSNRAVPLDPPGPRTGHLRPVFLRRHSGHRHRPDRPRTIAFRWAGRRPGSLLGRPCAGRPRTGQDLPPTDPGRDRLGCEGRGLWGLLLARWDADRHRGGRHGATLGRPHGTAFARHGPATPTRCSPSSSRPTEPIWRRQARTAPVASGRWPPGGPSWWAGAIPWREPRRPSRRQPKRRDRERPYLDLRPENRRPAPPDRLGARTWLGPIRPRWPDLADY